MQVEVTESCNHKCFYCYNGWQQKPGLHMPIESAKRLVNIICEEIKPFHVTITGGEPLLNLDSVIAMAEGFKKRGLFYNLNTNLTLLSNEKLEKIKESSTNGRFGILTSLPHYDKKKFEEITGAQNINDFYTNLENVIKQGFTLTVNMVVHKLNHKDIYNEGKFLFENYGVKNFAATPVVVPAFAKGSKYGDYGLTPSEIADALEDLLRLNEDYGICVDSLETIPMCLMPERIRNNNLEIFRRACSAGRGTISIDYNGNVRPCSHAPIKAGNVFLEPFAGIWEKLKPFRDNKYVPQKCKDCEEFYNCHGGCRFFNYNGGDLSEPDPRMTGVIKNFGGKHRKLPEIDKKKCYHINDNILFRKERDDLYTFFNGRFSNVMFVNEDFKNVILTLIKIKKFSYSELTSMVNSEDFASSLELVMRIMLDKRFLI